MQTKQLLKRPSHWKAEVIISSVLFTLAAAFWGIVLWVNRTFQISFQQVLYTITAPLDGSESDVVLDCIKACVPGILLFVLFILLGVTGFRIQRRLAAAEEGSVPRRREKLIALTVGRHVMAVLALAAFLLSCGYADRSLHISSYLSLRSRTSTLYEDHYVDPAQVSIAPPAQKKNLLCIYLESMENTYASKDAGGFQSANYIPNLTALARENISFSNTELLGGAHAGYGTNWTMAALMASTSGVPFSFPVLDNAMGSRENFAPGCTTLGEILADNGYQNVFLCGSDADFAGRRKYFQQHGDYRIYDLFTAREEGYIPEDYKAWWGYEDEKLYEIAKDKLLALSESGQPFNFTMLTVDTHHIGGYLCARCGDEYANQTANVVACADRQIAAFLQWCSQQDFYDDTVIVVTGDHPRMDNELMGGIRYNDRTVYNCILNPARPAPDKHLMKNREFCMVDFFPTILDALGFHIEGDRLGLGVSLFSGRPTLAESMGFQALNREIAKRSDYYDEHFS